MKGIILAGGSGTRLYPLSTENRPKQFLSIIDDKPLIINTIERLLSVCDKTDIIIVTGEKFKNETVSILSAFGFDDVNIVCEPCARNTFPAILLAVKYCKDILKCSDNELILVVPSDHAVRPLNQFIMSIEQLKLAMLDNKLCVIGIQPTRPNTAYGYIEFIDSDMNIKKVNSFKEKPDLATAEKYIKNNNYLWNAGMYGFTLNCFMNEINQNAIEFAGYYALNYKTLLEKFDTIKSISIDYALAEKSENLFVIKTDITWSDIGSWDSYYEYCKKDASGNVIVGNVNAIDCRNCLIYSEGERLNILSQTDKIIISANGNLIMLNRQDSQEIKRFFN